MSQYRTWYKNTKLNKFVSCYDTLVKVTNGSMALTPSERCSKKKTINKTMIYLNHLIEATHKESK